jgi:ClpP class serine protease
MSYNGAGGLDSYAAVRARVQLALESPATTIILHIDSPGGDVNGCFDGAKGVRADVDRAGKKLIAFCDSQACSSMYAWSAVADEIIISETATIGSIGVIAILPDQSAAAAGSGVKFNIITSGERKADGNPMQPMTDAARAAVQSSVDAMAGVFFAHVAEHRPLALEEIQSLQAGVRVGAAAVTAKLADSVSTLDAVLARDFSVVAPAAPSAIDSSHYTKDTDMAKEDEDKKDKLDARSALVAASEDPDEKDEVKRARAKRALAAYDAEMAAEDEPAKEDAKAAVAESASVAAVTSLSKTVQAYGQELAALRAEKAANDRKAFYATRPDLTPELIKTLDTLPIEQAKAVVSNLPAGNPYVPAINATSTVATSADSSAVTYLSPQAHALDIQMGLSNPRPAIVHTPTSLQLGVTPKAK